MDLSSCLVWSPGVCEMWEGGLMVVNGRVDGVSG